MQQMKNSSQGVMMNMNNSSVHMNNVSMGNVSTNSMMGNGNGNININSNNKTPN